MTTSIKKEMNHVTLVPGLPAVGAAVGTLAAIPVQAELQLFVGVSSQNPVVPGEVKLSPPQSPSAGAYCVVWPALAAAE